MDSERPISTVRLSSHFKFFRPSTVDMISASVDDGDPTRCFELFDPRNDYETFTNLRKKESFGKFENFELNLKNTSDYKFGDSRILEIYLKMTKRILNLMVVFQKPRCVLKNK